MYYVVSKDGVHTITRMKDDLAGNPDRDIPFSFEMKYPDFGKRYCFSNTKWHRRSNDTGKTIVRLYMGYPGTEYFYLRKLLRNRTHLLHVNDLLKHPEDPTLRFASYKVNIHIIELENEFYMRRHV
jgi:hypothetical protein